MQDANTVLLQYMQLVKGLLILLTVNTLAVLQMTLCPVDPLACKNRENSYFIEFVCISN